MRVKYRIWIAGLILGAVVGCSRSLILLAPEDLYALGSYHLEDGNYRDAAEQFERIRDDYPTSEYAAMSQFKLGEAQFLRKSYSKASVELELFIEFNPAHKLAPQAQYYLAMSKFNSIISPERDTTTALEAKTSLENFLIRYPEHPDCDKVRDFLNQVIDHLQMHEVEVAKSYYRMGLYGAALNRLNPVLQTKASDTVKQEAYYFIGKSYIHTGESEKARENLAKAAALETGGKYQKRAAKALRHL